MTLTRDVYSKKSTRADASRIQTESTWKSVREMDNGPPFETIHYICEIPAIHQHNKRKPANKTETKYECVHLGTSQANINTRLENGRAATSENQTPSYLVSANQREWICDMCVMHRETQCTSAALPPNNSLVNIAVQFL